MNALIIFLLIGVSHWMSHLLSCRNCRHNLAGVLMFFGHGILQTLGWPFFALEYLRDYFKKPEPFELSDEEKRLVQFHREVGSKIKTDVEGMFERARTRGGPRMIESVDDLPEEMPEEMKNALRGLFKTMDDLNKKDDAK